MDRSEREEVFRIFVEILGKGFTVVFWVVDGLDCNVSSKSKGISKIHKVFSPSSGEQQLLSPKVEHGFTDL